jgi:hypothetical protein
VCVICHIQTYMHRGGLPVNCRNSVGFRVVLGAILEVNEVIRAASVGRTVTVTVSDAVLSTPPTPCCICVYDVCHIEGGFNKCVSYVICHVSCVICHMLYRGIEREGMISVIYDI